MTTTGITCVGGSAEFMTLFLSAFPHAEERITRWILSDMERAPASFRSPVLSRFPSQHVPEDDIELVDRVLTKHWLDISMLAFRDGDRAGLDLRAWATDLVMRAVSAVRVVQRAGGSMLFLDLPHHTDNFALLAVAYEMGVPYGVSLCSTVDYLGNIVPSPFPFAAVDLASSLRAQPAPLSAQGVTLLARLRGSYESARPAYVPMQKRQRSLRGLLKKSLTKRRLPTRDGVETFVRRKTLRRAYEALAQKDVDGPFVYVPLHYQPERTTLPQGRMYADQELMVQRLARVAAQRSARLLVREHPSTFLLGGPCWRNEAMYQRLAAIPGVVLGSVDVDPFGLVDRSLAIATVTGTVALEAVARGKPVIVFGAPTYVGMPGMHEVRDATLIIPLPPAAGALEEWLARYEKSAISVDAAAAPLASLKRNYGQYAAGVLGALFPDRIEERDGVRWVDHARANAASRGAAE